MNRGFSLIEILIAMAIGVLVISAVFSAASGDQGTILGGELNTAAAARAQQLLEQTQAYARRDFNLANATATSDTMYQEDISVELLPDYVTKSITATIHYLGEYGQSLSSKFSTLATNLENVNAPNTCDSTPLGDWTHPQILKYTTLSTLLATSSLFSISDVDAYKGKVYLTVDRRSYKTDPVFFIVDVSSLNSPTVLGRLSNNAAATIGLMAVRTMENHTNGKRYAFTASKGATQLQIVNVSSPQSPTLASTLPITGGDGNTIVYHDNYVYLGLTSSGGQPEFHIVNAHDPESPTYVASWPPAGNIGIAINALMVRNGYAYLAHGTTTNYVEHVSVLDVRNPTGPYHVSGFLGPAGSSFSNSGNGKSLALVGDALYLGRTASNKAGVAEFFILNDTNPTAIPATPLGAITLSPDESIDRIIIRDYLAFILTKTKLRIFRIDDPAHATEAVTITLPASGGAQEPSIDCEGNTLFVTSNDASNNGTLTIVTPG